MGRSPRIAGFFVALAVLAVPGGPAWAASAAAAPAECRATVAEVRGADVYVAVDPACPAQAGDTLSRADGRPGDLRVVARSSSYVLTEPLGPGEWGAGVRVRRASTPGAAAADRRAEDGAGAAGAEWKAGPGARSAPLPAAFWQAAAAAVRPAPAGAGAGRGPREPVRPVVSGALGAGTSALVDRSARDAGWVRPWVDSTLTVDRPGGVPLVYRHRLRWQRRFAYDRAAQPWEDDYPEWAVRELAVSYAFLDERLGVTAGRFAPPGVGGAPTVDGGGVEGTLREGLQLGAFGGLLPHPTSLLPDPEAVGVGGYLRGRLTSGDLTLAGSLLLGGSAWQGAWETTHLDALALLRTGRWFDLHTSVRADVYGDFNPADRPVVDVSRVFAAARTHPLAWLAVGARYYLYRMVATRRHGDLWGADHALTGEPLHGAGLTADVDLPGGVALAANADVDVSDRAGLGFGAGGAVSWRLPIAGHWRLAARYGFDDAVATRSHVVGGDATLGVLPTLSLDLGYRYHHYAYRAQGASAGEHDVRLGLDWQALAALHVWADVEWWTGDEVEGILAQGHVGWRF
jgi:hypothetical protein